MLGQSACVDVQKLIDAAWEVRHAGAADRAITPADVSLEQEIHLLEETLAKFADRVRQLEELRRQSRTTDFP